MPDITERLADATREARLAVSRAEHIAAELAEAKHVLRIEHTSAPGVLYLGPLTRDQAEHHAQYVRDFVDGTTCTILPLDNMTAAMVRVYFNKRAATDATQ